MNPRLPGTGTAVADGEMQELTVAPDERGKAIGAWTGLSGVATAAGPFVVEAARSRDDQRAAVDRRPGRGDARAAGRRSQGPGPGQEDAP